MKFISWNVNGLRACCDKGFRDAFNQLNADFFCLQETKMQEGQLDLAFDGYTSYWNYAEKKGYSGTAIFTRHTPISVSYGLGIDEHDREGRVITLEMEDFYLITVYTPNSQDGLKRLDYRMTWEDAFRQYLLKLDAKKPVLVCGDLNVAHKEIDLKNPKTNRMNAGFTDQEREKLQALPTKSGKSSRPCWMQASLIPSAISIPTKKAFIHGGHTVSRHARKTQGGALITSWLLPGLPINWKARKSIPKYSVPTIVR